MAQFFNFAFLEAHPDRPRLVQRAEGPPDQLGCIPRQSLQLNLTIPCAAYADNFQH